VRRIDDEGGETVSVQEQIRVPSPDEVLDQLVQHLRRVIGQESQAAAWKERLMEAAMLLESLPLTTSEFSVASNRLNNACRYLESNEHGTNCGC
jgi:hypothetical protein